MDGRGKALTQRECPTMAKVRPRMDLNSEDEGVSLFLTAPGMEEIEVQVPEKESLPSMSVK